MVRARPRAAAARIATVEALRFPHGDERRLQKTQDRHCSARASSSWRTSRCASSCGCRCGGSYGSASGSAPRRGTCSAAGAASRSATSSSAFRSSRPPSATRSSNAISSRSARRSSRRPWAGSATSTTIRRSRAHRRARAPRGGARARQGRRSCYSAHFTPMEFCFPALRALCPRFTGMYKAAKEPDHDAHHEPGPGAERRRAHRQGQRARDLPQSQAQRRRMVCSGSELRAQGRRADPVLRRACHDEHGHLAASPNRAAPPCSRYFLRRAGRRLGLRRGDRAPLEGFPERGPRSPTSRRLTRLLEDYIRRCPEQYLVGAQALQGAAGAVSRTFMRVSRGRVEPVARGRARLPPELSSQAFGRRAIGAPGCSTSGSRGSAKLPFRWQIGIGRLVGTAAAAACRGAGAASSPATWPPVFRSSRLPSARRSHGATSSPWAFRSSRWRSAGTAPIERLRRLVRVEGREHLERAIASGRGVIILSAHFTSLETGFAILEELCPGISCMYRPQRNAHDGRADPARPQPFRQPSRSRATTSARCCAGSRPTASSPTCRTRRTSATRARCCLSSASPR